MCGESDEGLVTNTAIPRQQFVCGKAVASRPSLGVMTQAIGNERAEGFMTTSVVDPVWRFAVVAPSDWCGDVLGRQHAADGGDSGE